MKKNNGISLGNSTKSRAFGRYLHCPPVQISAELKIPHVVCCFVKSSCKKFVKTLFLSHYLLI